MAAWIKQQVGVVLTLLCLFAAVVAGYSRLATEQAVLCKAVERKADKEQVTRELDQIQFTLQRIEGKVDDLRR
ncbi:MAG: hypothetical protein PHR30_18745 [Gallionellaceae bacterium]|nr:hypothetical protein [Gallionellaceae bacterium]